MERSWKVNLFVLWIGAFFVSTAYSVSVPFVPIFLHDQLGLNEHLETWSGIIFAASFLASAFISPFWGSLADKYGRKPMMIRAGISLSITYMLYFFVQNPYEMVGVRIMEGLLAGYIPSAVTLIASTTPEKHTGYALGIMSTAGATGSIVGPLIGGFVSHWFGNREAFLVSSGMVMVALLIAAVWVKEPGFRRPLFRSRVWNDVKVAVANRGLLSILLMTMATSASVMILEPLLTLYVLQLGADKSNATVSSGIIFSAVGIATLIAAPRWGKIGNRIGYGKVLMIGLLGGGIGNLLQIAFHNLIGFGALRFGYGLFFAAVYPALNVMIVKTTDAEFRGRAFGLSQSSMQLGTMLGPVLGGFLASQLSIPAVFVINGTAMLLIAAAV